MSRLPRPIPAAATAGLLVLAVLPYLGALDHPLLRDDRRLLDNRWLVDESSAANVWRHDYWHGTSYAGSDLYRPVTVWALAGNARWAPSPAGFRAIQLAAHGGTVLLVWWVLALVARRLNPRDDRAVPAAWIGAALFAVHPLLSESVVFVVGRAEILAAGLGLAAFGVLLAGARREPASHARAIRRVVPSSVLLFLALASKESAVAWIAILGAWILVSRQAGWKPRTWFPALVGWSVSTAAFLVLRGAIVGWLPRAPHWVDNPLVLHDMPTRTANACLLLARYGAMMLWPRTLRVEYGFDQLPVVPLWPWGIAGALLVVLAWSAVAVRFWRLRRLAALWWWIFVPAAFALTSNVLLPIGVIFAERLAYLPLVGACALAGYGLARLRPRWAAILVTLLLLAAAGGRSARRTADFRDFTTYVETAAADAPRAVKLLANAGRTRLRLGRPADALAPLERAVEIWPDYPRALALLADTREALGDPAAAAEYRRRAEAAAARLRDRR